MSTPTPPPPTPTQPYKAIIGFIITFVGALLVEVQGTPGGDDLSNITATEWVVAVIAALAVAGGVYVTPNPAKTNRNRVA
jgi:integral membrane sensor domain MASE1